MKRVSNISITVGVAAAMATVGFVTSLVAAAPNVADKEVSAKELFTPAVKALSKSFQEGTVTAVKPHLSEKFEVPGFAATAQEGILKSVFAQAKGKVTGLKVASKLKTKEGYDLTLVADGGKKFTVSVDEVGKFTAFKFFKTKKPASAPIISKGEINAPAHDTIPFKLSGAGGLIMVKGEVNGVKGYLFVDTGASQSVLNSSVFPNLKGEDINTQGVSGEVVKSKLVPVSSMKFGQVEIKNMKALHQPLDQFGFGLDDKFLGLIGYSELSRFELMINYPKKTISFLSLNKKGERVAEAQLPEPVKKIKFVMDTHLPVLNYEIGGQKLRMGLDTGVELNLIAKKHEGKLGALMVHKRVAESIGANNKPVRITVGVVPSSKVEGLECKNMRAIFNDVSHLTAGPNGMKIDGMIGFAYLSKYRLVSINFKKKELTLW